MDKKTKSLTSKSKEKVLEFQTDKNSELNIKRKIKNNNNIVEIENIKKEKIKKQKIEAKAIKKEKIKDIDFVLLGIVAIIIVASISMIFTYIDQEMQIAELREQRAVILEKAKVEEKEIEHLEKILSQVGTMEFIERQARERLGMIKPGETIYVDLNKMRN